MTFYNLNTGTFLKLKYFSSCYAVANLLFFRSPDQFRRGLIIDKSKGNILKVDRHKYVRKVFHGLEEMNSKKRKETYSENVYTYTESNYVNIDTLFLVIDAILFANLVDFRDNNPDLVNNKSYEQMYKDVRTCVDMCHRDGVIKDAVMKDPASFIKYDPDLVPMLLRYRDFGKKVSR